MFTREQDLQERLEEWRKEFDRNRQKLKERTNSLAKLPKGHHEIQNRLKRIKRLEDRLDFIRNKCATIKYELDSLREQKRLINMEISSLSKELEELLEFGLVKQDSIDNAINQIKELEYKLIELDKI